MTYKIGVIAEDDTDVEVVRELINKLAHGKVFSIKKFAANGCGKLIGKCHQWSIQLRERGCNLLIVLHDLDERQVNQLKQQLENALNNSPIIKRIVVIPIKEIEAWLLSDHQAIERAMNLKQKVTRVANPESIADPKKYLGDIIYLKSGKIKHYLTNDNPKIAKKIDLLNLRRCSSFIPFENFINTNMT